MNKTITIDDDRLRAAAMATVLENRSASLPARRTSQFEEACRPAAHSLGALLRWVQQRSRRPAGPMQCL